MKLPKRNFFKRSPLSFIPKRWRRSVAIVAALVLLAGGPGAYFLLHQPNQAQAAWFDNRWGFRQASTITNSSGGALTNYQVKLTVNTSTLITAGKLQSACQDIRITDQTGKNLNYWIETGTNACNTSTTIIWVNVPTIPTGTSKLYLYYGNNSAVAYQNGNLTFDFFDDFSGPTLNTQKWTATGAYGITSGALTITSGAVYSNAPVVATTRNELFEMRAQWAAPSINYSGLEIANAQFTGGSNSNSNKLAYFMSNAAVDYQQLAWAADGSAASYNVVNGVSQFTPVSNTYYYAGFAYDATNLRYFQSRTQTNAYATSVAYSPYLSLGYFTGSTSASTNITPLIVDFVIARKYATTEPTSAFAAEETGTAPMVYYKFDEGTGATANNSGWANTAWAGTLTAFSSPPTATSGWQLEDQCLSGKCLRFNGSTNYVVTSAQQGPQSGVTVSAWVNPSTVTGTIVFAAQYDANAYMQLFAINGVVYFRIHQAKDTIYIGRLTGNILQANKWQHLEATWNGGTTASSIAIYVNGIQSDISNGSVGTFTGPYTGTVPLYVGGQFAAGLFPGTIDDFKMYNYARSAAQIKIDFSQFANKAGALPQSLLSNGLVGYWKFDENTGTTLTDWSGNSNNGTITSGTWTVGKFGSSLSFNHTSTYIGSIPNTNFNFERTNQFSGCSWIYQNNVTDAGHEIFSKITSSGSAIPGWEFVVSSGGYLSFFLSNNYTGANYLQVTTITATSPNTWQHVCFTYDGSSNATGIKIYMNGIPQSIGINNNALSASILSAANFQIGKRDSDTTYLFNGSMDESRIYNRALTPAEITQIYNFAPGPISYWKLQEGGGTTLNDSSGYANTGTWQGTLGSQWTIGKYGGGGNFNGSDNYISTTTNYGNGTSLSQMTEEAWFKTTTTASRNQVLISMDNLQTGLGSGFSDRSLWIDSNGKAVFYFFDSSGHTITSPQSYNDGNWHHAAATNNGTYGNLFVDGSLVASASGGMYTSYTTSYWRLGNQSGATSFFPGQMSDVRIYNYVRTQAQIQQDLRNDSSTNPEISLVGGSASGSATTQPASPIGLWHFDEGYGTVANNAGASGTALNGTLSNFSSPATSTSGWQTAASGLCKVNGCLAFNGSNNFVSVPATPSANLSQNNSFTFSAWVKTTISGATSPTIISEQSGNNGEFATQFRISTSNQFQFFVIKLGAAAATVNGITTVVTGTWYHVVAVYDGANVYLYVNGKLEGSTPLNFSGSVTSSANLIIGSLFGTGQYWSGLIDEPQFYNFALNQDQVRVDYNQGLSLNYGIGAASEASTLTGGAGAAPVGYWNFEEGANSTVNDASGNGNTGTWQGTLGKQWTAGKIGSGGNFNGTNNYVNVPDSTSLTITGSQITMAAWFKAVNSGTYERIMSKQTASAYYGMLVNSGFDGIYAALTTSGGTVSQNMPYSLVSGNWYYAVITYDGANLKLYMNGTFVSQLPLTGNILTTTGAPLSFGDYQLSSNQWFLGTIDEIKVYNYARTQAQIAYDYNRGAPVGWWKLNECQGTTAYDSSGNGYNGTISIGASGTYTSPGTCGSGVGSEAWNAGSTGKSNGSLGFAGFDDTINMGNVLGFEYTQPFSVAFWEKTTSNGAMTFISKQDTTANYQGWNIQSGSGNGFLYFQLVNTYSVGGKFIESYTTNNTNFYDGNWHLIVATYDGSGGGAGVKIYKDGVSLPLSGGGTITATSVNTASLEIGSRSGTQQMYIGQIDDARIFNYTLTATQIQTLYNGGFAAFYGPATGMP